MSRIKCEKCKEVFFGGSCDTLCLPCRTKEIKTASGEMCAKCFSDPTVWDEDRNYCVICGTYRLGYEKVCNECNDTLPNWGGTHIEPEAGGEVYTCINCFDKKSDWVAYLGARLLEDTKKAARAPETIEQKLDTLAEIMTCIGKDIERITDTYVESKMTRKG